MDKVIDAGIRSKQEITNHYVSNAGAAIAGGMMFGEIGALLAGQPEKITEKSVSKYFTVIYNTGGAAQGILFDVTKVPEATLLLNFYQTQVHGQKHIQL